MKQYYFIVTTSTSTNICIGESESEIRDSKKTRKQRDKLLSVVEGANTRRHGITVYKSREAKTRQWRK